MATQEPVTVERPEQWLAIVVLNREDVRNAISRLMADQLVTRLTDLALDSNLRALILTGAGTKAFCAGADLKERHRLTPRQRGEHTHRIKEAADLLWAFPVPVIAAIQGYALAGGAELAIACDLRVASEDAILGLPEVRIGIFPGAGAVERLPRIVGASRARRLLLTGRQVDADQALQIGLIDSLVPADYVMTEATRLARDIASQSPNAIRALKKAIRVVETEPADIASNRVAEIRADLDTGDDYEEGLQAFAERRSPSWSIEE
jgi:methylglutaconyl-CoA hydratase